MEFGNYIKKQRNNLGFTQAEIIIHNGGIIFLTGKLSI